ncbi:MAG: calcium-binding protein [Pseudomonadota bacterium]
MAELSLDEWLQLLDDAQNAARDAFSFSQRDDGPQRAVDASGNDIGDGVLEDLVISGSDGDDLLLAGTTDQLVFGNGGDDVIGGFAGNDTILGGRGNDRLDGDNGRDSLSGGLGKDSLSGGIGMDSLRGQGGKDELNGNGGRDVLNGGGGKDTLFGGGGRDRLEASGGRDDMFGGGGRDIFAFTTRQKGVIQDFKLRQDKIEIDNGARPPLEFADLTFKNVGDNLLIKAGGARIVVKNENVDSADDVPKGIFLFE